MPPKLHAFALRIRGIGFAPRAMAGYNAGLAIVLTNRRGRAAPGPPVTALGVMPTMIEALKDDNLVNRNGGRFKLTALIQHRVRELMEGARPLVERRGRNDIEVAIDEVARGKITYELPDLTDQDNDTL